MNGVTINGRHSLDDFGLYLQPKSIPAPAPKTIAVEVKGADGEIDLSTALTDGNMLYSNRVFELGFAAIGHGAELDSKIERFGHNIHGKTVKLAFDDDPDHYYTGRCAITEREYNRGYVVLTVEVNADPYRYDKDVTVVTKTVSGSAALTVSNARKWVVPTITASAEMELMYQGKLHLILEGSNIYDDVVLRDGANTLAFSGYGTVGIEYRQGVI